MHKTNNIGNGAVWKKKKKNEKNWDPANVIHSNAIVSTRGKITRYWMPRVTCVPMDGLTIEIHVVVSFWFANWTMWIDVNKIKFYCQPMRLDLLSMTAFCYASNENYAWFARPGQTVITIQVSHLYYVPEFDVVLSLLIKWTFALSSIHAAVPIPIKLLTLNVIKFLILYSLCNIIELKASLITEQWAIIRQPLHINFAAVVANRIQKCFALNRTITVLTTSKSWTISTATPGKKILNRSYTKWKWKRKTI